MVLLLLVHSRYWGVPVVRYFMHICVGWCECMHERCMNVCLVAHSFLHLMLLFMSVFTGTSSA